MSGLPIEPPETMIEARNLSKTFGTVRALDSVHLSVPRGSVLGLLGHNGAGKTTLVGILTTALTPTSGTASVAGHDVVHQPHEIRRRIGLTGQFASVDGQLSGRDNLLLIARLLGAGRRAARARADELLELFALQDVAERRARTYSGGLRRRLDLATSLVGHPEVVFLDEPTTGLDPEARLGLWEIVEGLVTEGATVLLTTQYLEEADRLADSITVLSGGRVIADGTAAELKAAVGRRTVTVTLDPAADLESAVAALRRAALEPSVALQNDSLVIPIDASKDVATVIRALDQAGAEASELSFGEPTLDDVYLALAGRTPVPVRSGSPALSEGSAA
ncbi:daunorubicin ABC transporter ATPase [Streptomyces spiroverticillatus]|uniref:Daunorubicin ABC transporter ATPase n=1 Tax=Streptomyces finlayi TaxID=67296 RepID=A0A918X5H0_9ACTN|nr:ATP-binding cassette domain-containing protein [Streptomyces finlayi]GHA43191.1 daunorubicin ABC transporter ATPase [Streptomyces spiroverticillatus]GHD13527.1 daunorubicin ABC transporter ATPase [Streptomyces finlayi]